MINGAERIGNSSEINAEQQKHPLEQMPSFEEHMQSDFEQQNEDTTDDDENWIDDWDDEDNLDEETRKNIESWGTHISDEDFDPTIRLTENDLLARDINSAKRRQKNYQQERAQELFERELKKDITNIEDLEFFAKAEVEGLSLENINYNDKDIKVIHATGFPLKFLESSINSSFVADNPSIWTKNASEYSSFSHQKGATIVFNPDEGEVSNTICTTYVDTNHNPSAIHAGATGLVFVFTDIKPDSVIAAKPHDAWSSPDSGFDRPNLLENNDIISPEEIAKQSKGFNEIVLRRYDETGKPLLPSAIMTYDLIEPNERILKNASYFNIPIIHIDKKAYE